MKLKYIKAGRDFEDRYELWVTDRTFHNNAVDETDPLFKTQLKNGMVFISDESWSYRMSAVQHEDCLLIGEIRGNTDRYNGKTWQAFVYTGSRSWREYRWDECYKQLDDDAGSLADEKELLEDYFMANGVYYLGMSRSGKFLYKSSHKY